MQVEIKSIMGQVKIFMTPENETEKGALRDINSQQPVIISCSPDEEYYTITGKKREDKT